MCPSSLTSLHPLLLSWYSDFANIIVVIPPTNMYMWSWKFENVLYICITIDVDFVVSSIVFCRAVFSLQASPHVQHHSPPTVNQQRARAQGAATYIISKSYTVAHKVLFSATLLYSLFNVHCDVFGRDCSIRIWKTCCKLEWFTWVYGDLLRDSP